MIDMRRAILDALPKDLILDLEDRLRAEALLEEHPQIRARPLPVRFAVAGMGRSGTTLTHRLRKGATGGSNGGNSAPRPLHRVKLVATQADPRGPSGFLNEANDESGNGLGLRPRTGVRGLAGVVTGIFPAVGRTHRLGES